VQRLLSFGRPQEAERKAIDLQPMLQEAVRLLRSALPAGVALNLHTSSTLPAVQADASLLHQVVLNLVTNAWHALGGRTGRIDIRLEGCRVDSRLLRAHPELQRGAHVRLSVSDTGEGIDTAILNRIFEPFFTTKAPGAGTGLGLSVVHGIVRSHGGAIHVESELGKGTTFFVYLPASTDAAASALSVAPPEEAQIGRGELILVIDDEPALVKLAEQHLQRLGYRVEGYTHPAEALMAFREDPQRFDLVITDYSMPQLSGLEVAQQLLRLRPDVVIALVSGYMQAADIEQARALGVKEVILKPFTMRDLSPIVQQLLASRSHAEPRPSDARGDSERDRPAGRHA
jgi:CheY-like chemotaxis protein